MLSLFYVFRKINGLHIVFHTSPNYQISLSSKHINAPSPPLPSHSQTTHRLPLSQSLSSINSSSEALISQTYHPTSSVPPSHIHQTLPPSRPPISQAASSKTSRSLQSEWRALVQPSPDSDVSHAITDIVFVCSLDKVPTGYKVVSLE